MSETEHFEPWVELSRLASEADVSAVNAFLDDLSPGDLALAISRLSPPERVALFTALGPERSAELAHNLPSAQAAATLSELPAATAADLVEELPSAEQADLLGELPAEEADAILHELPAETADRARELLAYDPSTAGGLMKSEFLRFPVDATLGEVLEDLQENGELYSDYAIQYGYVVTREGELRGVLRLRDLLFAPKRAKVAEAMIRDPLAVSPFATIDDLHEVLERHSFVGLPVVGDGGRLLGVVEAHDVELAREDAAEDTLRKVSGIVGGEEIRSLPLRVRFTRRLSWLSANIVLNVIAASVIAMYEETLEAVIALAVFLPIISDMSGCSGNQAVTVSIRELSLGLVKPKELGRVLGKEILVGLINGLVLGAFLGGLAFLWKGNVYLGLVVGGALLVNTVLSVSLGGCLPLILKRMGRDPALASAPILTTVTDLMGFLLVLSGASALLARLI